MSSSDRPQILGNVGELRESAGRLAEGAERTFRLGRRGELFVIGLTPKLFPLSKEGSSFTANSPVIGTGVVTGGNTQTAWVATTPTLIIVNRDSVGGKDIFLDRMKMIVTVAGVALTSFQYAVFTDMIPRYSSGGTQLVPKNANTAASNSSIAEVRYGAITAVAASADVRSIGRGVLRSQIPTIGDEYILDFGGLDSGVSGNNSVNPVINSHTVAPVIVGPGHVALVYTWGPAMTTSPEAELEMSWLER